MKNQMKGNNGITLIALVITIIVILILAGVTIATLTGDNGLLQKATNAKQANEEASALEKIKVEVAGSYGLDGKIDKTQLVKNLKKIQGLTYNDSEINENTIIDDFPATVNMNGSLYFISEKGSVDKAIWIDNKGSYTNAETGQTLTVGDTVKYEIILNKTENAVDSEKLEQLKTDLQNNSGNSSSTDNSRIDRESLIWKVLDVKDGKIRLISEVPTITNKIALKKENGYNNAVYLIDKVCDTLYSIDGLGKAQNLKIEDIEGKINTSKFDYTQYSNSCVDTGKYGGTKEYTSNLQYPNIYPSEVGCKGIDGESGTNNNTGTLELSEQTSALTGMSTATRRLKMTTTYWYKSMVSNDFTHSKYYSLLINNGSNLATYWLSSRCVLCTSSNVGFGVFRVGSSNVDYSGMFYSDGGTSGNSCAFRPVVTLEYNIKLSGDSTNGWTIQ